MMKKDIIIYANIIICVLSVAYCLPVTNIKKHDVDATNSSTTPDLAKALEYERYLKEVIEALESDTEFRKKLDKAAEVDIRNGKIAQELDFVSHHIRTKLDEIKRRELERLRALANKQYELSNDIEREHMKMPLHVDHTNSHTFEIEDLRRLIKKTTEDLAAADRKRREEFKEYEMQKKFEREMVANELDDHQRPKFLKAQEELKKKHNQHEKIHYPGNKAQLEEVWEKQDHMDRQDFDPRTFFMIHDVDGNSFWDETEVKALFVKELDKVYQSSMPEDDMRERIEEMERMREHVFKAVDTNRDGLISFQEFLDQTKREQFNRDPAWETVDEQIQYTHEEYLEFERRRRQEVDRMIAEGLLPPHPNMPQGYYPTHAQNAYPNVYNQQHAAQQMHYQHSRQEHMQQQQEYQEQLQQEYLNHLQQQQQQQQQKHLPVQLNSNQVYQDVPANAPHMPASHQAIPSQQNHTLKHNLHMHASNYPQQQQPIAVPVRMADSNALPRSQQQTLLVQTQQQQMEEHHANRPHIQQVQGQGQSQRQAVPNNGAKQLET